MIEFKDFYIVSVGGSITSDHDIAANSSAQIITFPSEVNAMSWLALGIDGDNKKVKLLLKNNTILLTAGVLTAGVYTHFSGSFIQTK